MTPTIEIAIIVLTAVIVIVAFAVVRALSRFSRAVDAMTEETGPLSTLLEDARKTSNEIRELVAKLESISNAFQGAASRIGSVGERAASVSSAMLDQIEPPVRQALSLVNGFRVGAEFLADRWSQRSPAEGPRQEGSM